MSLDSVALLGMVTPGAGFCGVTPFRSKNRWKPREKKVIALKLVGFWPRNMWSPKHKDKKVFAAKLVGFRPKWGRKKDLLHKSVEIWFHLIIWCHPKMVTPGAGRPPLATPLAWLGDFTLLRNSFSMLLL